jgi:type II secretory ATPase GspE/PulE/Tfp pilus assembly ATPase PilB-like protein
MTLVHIRLTAPEELFKTRRGRYCLNTGYRDRVNVFEAVVARDEIGVALQRNASEEELRHLIRDTRSKGLVYDALAKVREGVTSLNQAFCLGSC